MTMQSMLARIGPASARLATFLVAAFVGAACGTTGPTLKVDSEPTGPIGAFKSVKLVCTAEDPKEKGQEFTGRMETQLMVKLKEREAFQEFKLSKDEGTTDVTLKVVILDMKKAGGWGWYGRSSSKVSCDATLVDNKTNATVVSISVVAKPKYSNVETALEDAATQIADYLREKK
jgi:hypothetical protein